MILLSPAEDAGRRFPAVGIVGAGLIGGAVASHLRSLVSFEQYDLPLDWSDPETQTEQLKDIEDRIVSGLRPDAPLTLLWSAGRAGFDASLGQVAAELASYRRVLATVGAVARRRPDVPLCFVLLSSAGGLFEGQVHVGPDSVPSPRRPYGTLKLEQETLLSAAPAPMTKQIYRLTSVYGYVAPDRRQGLIPSLIANGLRQRECHITGHITTLRDFVWVEDLARFLAGAILQSGEAPGYRVCTLASAKPSSILEIRRIIETMLRRRLYVSFSRRPSNSEDITFSSETLPPDWQPSDLRSSIRCIHADAVSGGLR